MTTTTTPDGTTPDGTTPDGTTPDGTTPDGTTPDGTTPDWTTPHWIGVAVAAQRAGVTRSRVEQWLRDGHLVGRRDADGALVPAQCVSAARPAPDPGPAVDADAAPAPVSIAGGPVKGLPGVITLLRDARFSDAEIVEWLFRTDDTLPGTPVQALAENRGTEVKRRAQVAGY